METTLNWEQKMKTKELENTFERIKTEVSDDVRKKMESVQIDFGKDNYLPELNKEALIELGKSSKPVLLKGAIIKKNKKSHADITERKAEIIIATGLYNTDLRIPANKEKRNYFNFIARLKDDKHSIVLLELEENKENFEIVNFHFIDDDGKKRKEKIGKQK
jgi:hypothetical protein